MADNLTDLKHSDAQYDAWRQVEKEITFDGGTAGAIGEDGGAQDPFDIFTVTGTVKVKLYAICTTLLAGATATLEIGVTGATASLIAQSTATDIEANEIWHDASPDSPVELDTVAAEKIIANGLNVIGTVDSADITSGVIKFICLWKPVSKDGNVVAAS